MFEQDKKDSHSSQNICHTPQYPQTVSLDLQGIKVLKAVLLGRCTKPNGFSILEMLLIGPVMVLGCLIFRLKSWDGCKIFF